MNTRRLSLQRLENRYAPAGNVTAIVLDGDLFLTGDSADNAVSVIYRSTGGISIFSNSGTTLNGSASPVQISNFVGDINAQMLGGNDTLGINPDGSAISLPGSVLVNLGSGNDTFRIQGYSTSAGFLGRLGVNGSIAVFGRDGNDTCFFARVNTAGDFSFYGGDGNDSLIDSNSNSYLGAEVSGQITVDLSTGDDVVNLGYITAHRMRITDPIGVTTGSQITLKGMQIRTQLEMYLSVGNDTVDVRGAGDGHSYDLTSIGELIVHTGLGDDSITIHHGEASVVALYTGEGNEGGGYYGVTLTELSVIDRVYVDLAGGLDNILIDTVSADTMEVYGGTENDGIVAFRVSARSAIFAAWDAGDVIGLHESTYDQLSVYLGDGDDDVWVRALAVAGVATFDGGTGNDTFHDLGTNVFGQLIRQSV